MTNTAKKLAPLPVAGDATNILYTSDNEAPCLMTLGELIANFDRNNGWHPKRHRDVILDDMRLALVGGWYENLHDDGRYVVLNLDKLQLCPTPDGWDTLYTPKAKPVYWTKLAEEFPDFDQSTLPAVPAKWEDVSWHNDATPSWSPSPDHSLLVYVDYADPVQREVQGGYRFTVINEDVSLLETDNWQEVLDKVAHETCEGHRDTGRGVCAHCGKALI